MSDQAPLILTLGLAPADQARFDRLRAAHFPRERNLIDAHVTLFHHLPGAEFAAIDAMLTVVRWPPFTVRVTGLRSLGGGVAFTLEAAELTRLRAMLVKDWHEWLGAQDRQGFRPHITVQNKVAPEQARLLLAALSAGFAPFDIGAIGLQLWRYRGGPWEPAGNYPFRAPPADLPAPHHR